MQQFHQSPSIQPSQQFHQPRPSIKPSQQYHQPAPPPPAAATMDPPTITKNVSRLGSQNQRNRVYVQDTSVSSGRSGGYFNAASNSQFQQVNKMGYMSQPPETNSAIFQHTGQFNTPSSYAQQGGFPRNQFNQPLPPSPGSFNMQSGQMSNGGGMDNVQQPPSLYNPMEHAQAPQQQSAFMQPTSFPPPQPAGPVVVPGTDPILPAVLELPEDVEDAFLHSLIPNLGKSWEISCKFTSVI
jgi:hypothetical protein